MRIGTVGTLLRSHWTIGVLTLGLGLLVPATRTAPALGAIQGTIKDEAGAPIPGAQVRLDGTALGAIARADGRYRIDSVPVGIYSMTTAFVGYRPARIEGLRVEAGQVTLQDLTLAHQAVDIAEIEVHAARNLLMPRDAVSSRQEIGGAYVDGVPVSPNGQGGQFVGPAAGRVDLSTRGFEQASVTPGGASAEFGNAQRGIITGGQQAVPGGEEYHRIYENRFRNPVTDPLSTFSIDVDAASYANVRRFLTDATLPPPDAVRIEEMINYFRYDYPQPAARHPFSVTLEQGACPWNPDHRLVLVGLQGRQLDLDALPPSNLVFLLDVSGSMSSPDKLPLVKQAFRLLVQQLRPRDRVAIVVYAGAAGLVLPSTPGSDKAAILAAIDQLESGGSTAGGAGIQLAYGIATDHFLRHGNNRVILATDGDFNVGVTSEGELTRLIEEKRESGVFLTVLGFGTGNLKDARMEQLADKGNGHYAYVDNLREARKVFVRELGGTLHTIAKDVKLQVEFNPARVAAYRLVGYENRVLATEDFADDRKDAGDLGAGHSVTALYEIVPADPEETAAATPELRYQAVGLTERGRAGREWMTVKLRYKEPAGSVSRLLQETLPEVDRLRRASVNFRFASAVAEFGLLLRGSEHRGLASTEAILSRAEGALGSDPEGDRGEFLRLVEQYRRLTSAHQTD